MSLSTRVTSKSDAASSWGEEELSSLESAHPEGLSVQQIVDAFASHGERLTEATFRKYVQLGLLPRSVRVGRKGKHRGSQGFYPASVVRRIDMVRRLMGQGYTIEEIQRDFLAVRSEVELLGQHVTKLFEVFAVVVSQREQSGAATDPMAIRAIADARKLAEELQRRVEGIERRLSVRARMARAAV